MDPMLDVSEVLSDPMFTETISIVRRPIVMVKGRATVQNPQTFNDIVAVVNSGISELMRAADQENMPNTISVHTQFRLQGPARNGSPEIQYLPDIVIWRGDNYVIKTLDDYSKYGAGFTRADCESVDTIDQPPGTD